MTRTIKLLVEYDGTEYFGFQRQSRGKTIQETLEKTLAKVCQEKITVIGAGRTDAGVHAIGQVCHVKTHTELSTSILRKALNAELPRDIVIHEAREMPDDFHARHSATARTYAYFVLNRPTPSALFHRFVHWVSSEIDVQAMKKACRHLVGKKDFSSFMKKGSSSKTPIISVREVRIFRGIGRLKVPFAHLEKDVITFTIRADSFLYGMVRALMGTLLDIGKKKMDPKEILTVLHERNRSAAGAAISPKGLFLIRVNYPRKYLEAQITGGAPSLDEREQ